MTLHLSEYCRMSNKCADSPKRPRGRGRNRSSSPLHQTHFASSEDSIDSEIDDQSSNSSPAPAPLHSRGHRRKASRIEDVSELSLDLKSLSADQAQTNQPLPPTPNPPTPPPKLSPALDPLQPAPLKIKKKPLQGKPQLLVDTMQLSSPRAVRLLIASIGNPKPYHSTRHSAGHHLLQALASTLQFPTLSKNKTGLLASGATIGQPEYTLWQSTSSMNVSGVNLLKAWKSFTSEHDRDSLTGIVILHDELESAPGTLKVRRGPTSAKGHNGIKSIQDSFSGGGVLKQLGENRFIKIGIGIGRPQSRDKNEVSGYVLGQLTGKEKKDIADKADELVGILQLEVQSLSMAAE